MKSLLKLFLLSALSLTFISCQKKASLKKISWQKGQPESQLKELNVIAVTPAKSQIIYKNQKIQHFEQAFDSETTITGTAIKKVFSANNPNDVLSAEATYFEKNLLPKKFEFSVDSAKALSTISKLITPNKIKSYSVDKNLEMDHQNLNSFLLITYEIEDGTLWLARLNHQYEILNIRRLGSRVATDTMAHVYTVGPKLGVLTDILLQNVEKNPTLSNNKIFVDSEALNKITVVSPVLKFDPKDERFDQIQVYYYLNKVQGWINKNLDVQFVDRLDAIVNVGYPEKTNTAFYYQNKIRLGRGDDDTYSAIASDPSIVYHEAFHALIDGLARLPYEKEGGSINEAFADFYTCVMLDRPYLAEASYLKGPYKRTLEINRRLDEKNGGLYHDSLIVSGLLWEIKEKLGQKKALSLATETLVKLNHYSEFSDLNQKLLAIIQEKLSGEDLQTIQAILKKRGFKHE